MSFLNVELKGNTVKEKIENRLKELNQKINPVNIVVNSIKKNTEKNIDKKITAESLSNSLNKIKSRNLLPGETEYDVVTKETKRYPENNIDYKKFKATYYNPTDINQTKKDNIGIGAFNNPVNFGDVAMGVRKYKQGTLIEIPELKDVKTPYGNGLFRINDKKNIRYNTGQDSFDIALPTEYPKSKELSERIGINTFTFKIIN